MSTKQFYNQISKTEGYNIKDRENLINRSGYKRLIAFDDRFLQVVTEIEKSIDTIPKNKSINILDVGCGDGVFEFILSEKVNNRLKFYGIDISTKQIQKGKQYFHEVLECDFDNNPIPYPDSFFDIVICSDVLEHVFTPKYVLAEISRVLKRGSNLILTVPNVGALQTRIDLLLSGSSVLLNYPENTPHIRFFHHKNIKSLTDNNFKLIKYYGLSALLFGKWNSYIYFPMPRLLQQFCNKYLPQLALGNLFVLQKK